MDDPNTPLSPSTSVDSTEPETAEQKYARLYEAPPPPPPVVQTPPPPDPLTSELLETVRALKSEIGGLKQAYQTPSSPKGDVPPPTQWFDYLRQGEWEKAETDLINRVKGKVLVEAQANALREAQESMSVQLEVDRYLTGLRSSNPDIVPMEGYLQAPVQNRIERLKQEGKISSNQDFVREYKAIVEDEVQKLRKITGTYRAAGTNEARVRQQEVQSSTPLAPQQVSSLQEGSPQPAQPDVSTENYFTRRKAVEAIRKGMGPTSWG